MSTLQDGPADGGPPVIAHVSPTYFSRRSVVGGGERYVEYVAQAVRAAEPAIRQVVLGCGAAPERFERRGIEVTVLADDSGGADAMDAQPDALWGALRDVDLVHVHQCLTRFGAFATVVAKTLRKPVVMTDLGGGDEKMMLDGKGMELADAVVSISGFAGSLIAPYYSGRHEVIMGPVDTEAFAPAGPRPRNRKSVICVGRLLPHKGVDRIIAALPQGLELKVVGSAYDRRYQSKLRELASGKAVTFVHEATDDDLRALYNEAGLFVQASTHKDIFGNTNAKPELLGLTSLEALASGLPIAVSSAGSLPELATDPRVTAVFDTTADLRAILEDFRDGRWPLEDPAVLARSIAVDTFGMKSVGERFARLYGDLVAAHRQ